MEGSGIRTKELQIRIQAAKKHMDPDPEHWGKHHWGYLVS
jgi:hypothetical protein